jgi:hypothetical protein
VSSITDVLRVIAPLLVYFIVMFFVVLWICSRVGVSYGRSATQAFTGASNNFEASWPLEGRKDASGTELTVLFCSSPSLWPSLPMEATASKLLPRPSALSSSELCLLLSGRMLWLIPSSHSQSTRSSRTLISPRMVPPQSQLGRRTIGRRASRSQVYRVGSRLININSSCTILGFS